MLNRSNILIVDDHPENLTAMQGLLEGPEINLIGAGSGMEALRLVKRNDFDLVLLDVQMPGMDGFETAKLIHNRKNAQDIPIIFVSPKGGESQKVREGYELGAIDYIVKPIDPVVLRSKVRAITDFQRIKKEYQRTVAELEESKEELRQSNAQLTVLATTDPLTGLFNRRRGMELLRAEIGRVREGEQCLSVIMMDLDYFKQVNDTHGHGVGDIVLSEIASRLRDACRRYDKVIRWGGEELLIICPHTDARQIKSAAKRFHSVVSDRPIEIPGLESIAVTASLGTASTDSLSSCHAQELLSRADEALYKAKDDGRNCVRISSLPQYTIQGA